MPKDAHFTMIGTVRGPADEQIVTELKESAQKMGISDRISFEINISR